MHIPLSEKLRPQNFDEVVGQPSLTDKNGWLRKSIQIQKPFSLFFYGPPGSGKTTIAKLYAKSFNLRQLSFSGSVSSIAEIKKEIQKIKNTPLFSTTMLFVDELHRLNKAQQDFFLPLIEDGTVILLGASTENPSFTINNALLSRMRVCTLKALEIKALEEIFSRYETIYNKLKISDKNKAAILHSAQKDARTLLNILDYLHPYRIQAIDTNLLEKILWKKKALYDQKGDYHYNLISAFHKSVRGSDPDASLYWLERMLLVGEDPLYIARRLIRIALEDVGLADPQALSYALHAYQAYQTLGTPEGEIALSQITIYLCLAPKSNATYLAQNQSKQLAHETAENPPPTIILNAPTTFMKQQGYGKGYQYDHDTPNNFSGQNYFPKKVFRKEFYLPKDIGFEREMKKRKLYFAHLRKKLNASETK